MSYIYDAHVFHYLVEKGLTFLCMTDDKEKRRLPFAFLDDIQQRFTTTYGERSGRKPPTQPTHPPTTKLLL